MPDSKKKKYDYTLLAALFLLMIMGLVILYSTSAYNGEVKFHDSFYYLKKQLFATLLGIAAMLVMAGMDYHIWRRFAIPGYVVAILLSVAVMLFGDEYNGSKRWLSLGPFSFQPSEFVKILFVFFVASGDIVSGVFGYKKRKKNGKYENHVSNYGKYSPDRRVSRSK